MSNKTARPPHRDVLLTRHLQALLGDAAFLALAFLQQHFQWIELTGGEVLMEQGESGDSAYLCISGRLRVYLRGEGGSQRMVREMASGEVIGEMSLYTGEPRSATVVALRDSVLVKLDKPHFDELLALSPQASITFTRQIIGRLQTEHLRLPVAAPVTVGMLPITMASHWTVLHDGSRNNCNALAACVLSIRQNSTAHWAARGRTEHRRAGGPEHRPRDRCDRSRTRLCPVGGARQSSGVDAALHQPQRRVAIDRRRRAASRCARD